MDTKQIKNLMKEFGDSPLSRLKIEKEGFKIEMEKGVGEVVAVTPKQVTTTSAVSTASERSTEGAQTPKNENIEYILSPMVGTFYEAPSPDSPPFVKVGDVVKKGQTLAILEAMKIMNELEAEFDCKIVEILVSNAQPVEYDMPLFAVERV